MGSPPIAHWGRRATHPWQGGVSRRHLRLKHVTPEASPIPRSRCHLCREQPKPWRAKTHKDQPTGVCNTSFNKTTPLPRWDQGRAQETKEAPSLAKGREILTGAFIQQRFGEFPLLLPTKTQSPPTLRGVLSTEKDLTITVSSARNISAIDPL